VSEWVIPRVAVFVERLRICDVGIWQRTHGARVSRAEDIDWAPSEFSRSYEIIFSCVRILGGQVTGLVLPLPSEPPLPPVETPSDRSNPVPTTTSCQPSFQYQLPSATAGLFIKLIAGCAEARLVSIIGQRYADVFPASGNTTERSRGQPHRISSVRWIVVHICISIPGLGIAGIDRRHPRRVGRSIPRRCSFVRAKVALSNL